MSNWITDRRPTAEDAYYFEDVAYEYVGCVWVTTEHGHVLRQAWNDVGDRPWMPIAPPEPYVKPKRWEVDHSGGELWGIFDQLMGRYAYPMIPTREAAERIAAIYEEVMP